jgi:vacuole morphology and inheritance protein 14
VLNANSNVSSAELEMTVNMLIQIDKLVQLLESPVFTCTVFP